MHKDLTNIYYKAENDFLTTPDLKALNSHLTSLAKRLETYNFLRDNEIIIFQPLANKLSEKYISINESILENVLKQWMSILRYAAWSMLINEPKHLEQNILSWLTNVIKAQEIIDIHINLSQLLNDQLKELLSEEKYALITPFLTLANQKLFSSK